MDLPVFSNNPDAAKGVKDFKPDPDLPEKSIEKVLQGIEQAFQRVRLLKQRKA